MLANTENLFPNHRQYLFEQNDREQRQVRREVRRGKNCLKNKMSVSASMGPSAFSQDGKYYSQIGNDGRCRIWDTETNVLKQEFTPDLHLSAPLSCLYWIQLDSGTSNPKWKSRKRKSSRPEEENEGRAVTHCVAFGSTTGKVLIYSITHAKVESVLEDPNPTPGEQDINCMDWNKKHGLFTCSSDSTVRQWSIEDGTVKTKFRMSKFEKGTQSAKTTAIKIPNYQAQGPARKLLITAACTLKLWCLDSKTILRSMVGHAGEVCHLDAVSFSQDGRFYIISGSKADRILSFWSVSLTPEDLNKTSEADTSIESKSKSAKRRSRTKSVSYEDTTGTDTSTSSAISTRPSCNFLMEDIARQVCVRASDEGTSEIKMIAVTRRGVVHYYEHTLNGVSTKPIKPDTTIQVVSEEKSQVKLAAAVCGTLQGDAVLVGYTSCGGLKFERITADTSEKTQVLIRTVKEKEGKKENQKMRSEDITKIRDGDSKDNSVVYLTSAMGRGDSDLKRPIGSKKVDIPMEMRLANLSITQSGTGLKNGPEIKNMAQLLVQALHSKDPKLLQTVFECVDPEVAFNTMNRLPIQYLPALLEHLTTMLAGKTSKCKSACVWAAALCRARSSSLLNQQLTNTRPLLSAFAARTPALPRLLALKARLGMLTSRSQDGQEKPTLEYRDTSSEDGSEDEMDEAIMNTLGDDSGSWNEEDDDEDGDGSSKGSDQEMSQ